MAIGAPWMVMLVAPAAAACAVTVCELPAELSRKSTVPFAMAVGSGATATELMAAPENMRVVMAVVHEVGPGKKLVGPLAGQPIRILRT